VCVCVCVCVCAPRNPFESPPTARFNNPKVLSLLQTMSSTVLPCRRGCPAGTRRHTYAISMCVCVCVCVCVFVCVCAGTTTTPPPPYHRRMPAWVSGPAVLLGAHSASLSPAKGELAAPPPQMSPCLGQSLCAGDGYEHSVPARPCRSTVRPGRHVRLPVCMRV